MHTLSNDSLRAAETGGFAPAAPQHHTTPTRRGNLPLVKIFQALLMSSAGVKAQFPAPSAEDVTAAVTHAE